MWENPGGSCKCETCYLKVLLLRLSVFQFGFEPVDFALWFLHLLLQLLGFCPRPLPFRLVHPQFRLRPPQLRLPPSNQSINFQIFKGQGSRLTCVLSSRSWMRSASWVTFICDRPKVDCDRSRSFLRRSFSDLRRSFSISRRDRRCLADSHSTELLPASPATRSSSASCHRNTVNSHSIHYT